MRLGLASLVLVLAACGGAPAKPAAPPPPVGDRGVDVANLKARLPPYLDSVGGGDPARALSGFVLVAQHDQVLFAQGYGFANRTTKRVATADTSFRIGSVTKQFTAAAILRLEQDGKLSVGDPVSKHLPWLTGPAKDVTIHQLLTHTAGVPNYTADQALVEQRAKPITVRRLVASFADKPLEFPPGTQFRYSNSGYALLGAIIEAASGMTYAQYLKTALFVPAKLAHTEVGDAIGAADRAEGYGRDNDQIEPANPIDLSFAFAAGGIRSTANDLVRWHRALSGDAILNAAERAKLYHPERDNYAYGWSVTTEKDHTVYAHNGGIDGFSTIYLRVPEADLVVVGWSNIENNPIDSTGDAALSAALGAPLKPIAKTDRRELPSDQKERLPGTYVLTPESRTALGALNMPPEVIDSIKTMEITATPHGIQLKPAGQGAVDMPLTDDGFFDADHGIRVRFDLAAPGPAKSFTLEQNGLTLTFARS